MSLRMTEEDLAAMERSSAVRVRRDPALAPVPAPTKAEAPTINVQSAPVDMTPVANALEGGLNELAQMMGQALAQALRDRPAPQPGEKRPPPIRSATVTVVSSDYHGNPTKFRFDFER